MEKTNKRNNLYEYIVKQGEAIVDVKTNDLRILLHMKNYLELFGNEALEETDCWKLEVYVESQKYNYLFELFDDAEEIILEYGDKGKIVINDNNRYIYNCRTKSILIIENKKIVIVNCDMRGTFIDAYKALRQLIAYQYLAMGAIPIHSSCISLGGQGIMFVGNKMAGKTTLSVKAAFKYGRLCDYLGNDRIFVYEKNGKYYTYALPTVIGMGLGMIKDDKHIMHELTNKVHQMAGGTASLLLDQPNIEESLKLLEKIDNLSQEECWKYIDNKLWITPAELSVMTNCKCGLTSELRFLILPQIGAKETKVEFSSEVAYSILSNNILDISNLYPNWLGLKNNIVDREEINSFLNKMCSSVEVIVAEGEPDSILDIVDSIIVGEK